MQSILKQEDLSKPFPLKKKYDSKYKPDYYNSIHENYKEHRYNAVVNATFYPDRDVLQDGGNVRILVELSGAVPSENDYLTIRDGKMEYF